MRDTSRYTIGWLDYDLTITVQDLAADKRSTLSIDGSPSLESVKSGWMDRNLKVNAERQSEAEEEAAHRKL